MGIPREFNKIIQKQLKVNAAWLPVTNTFTLGDYGIISAGVFTKMGNIKEYNVSFDVADGPEATIGYNSENTTTLKFAGGTEVDVIPSGAIDAKIKYKFKNEKSFLVKAPVIKVSQIQNVNQVAIKLRDSKNWGRRWKVVYQVYNAINPLIVSTISANTELTLSGNAEALKNLKAGSASLDLGTTKELGLNVHGKSGIIGLGLFRLKLNPNHLAFLTDEEKKAPAEVEMLNSALPQEDDL
jgi:hypothetical protein